MKKLYSLLIISLLFSACTARVSPTTAAASLTPMPTPTDEETLPPSTLVVPTPAPDPTATADTRLPPERWQEWPVVPAATGRAIEIYRQGLAMGLDPNAFSKVGDCQSVKAAFMGYLDLGNYPDTLKVNYPNLQETIDHFKGHFNTDGQAVRGGFNAAAVLSPLWADPKACLPGENPLDCELRLTRPIIVIVRMEIWWDGRTAESYEKLMRRILDDIIAHGAVPILATKADNIEGDNSLNLATARLAYEYDLPLWNFWASVQDMPNHGLDTVPPHNDGFHISIAAWNIQSFTGLQALDNVWRGLLAAGPGNEEVTPTPQATATAGGMTIPVETPAPTASPTPGPAPLGGSDRLIFGVADRQGNGYEYQGVYLTEPATGTTHQIFGRGVQFQSASADGKYILVNAGSSLYRANVDGAFPLLLSDSLFEGETRSATWLPDGHIAALLTGHSGSPGIAILSDDGSILNWLPESAASPIQLYPAVDENHIYWESGSCTSPGVCTPAGAWVSGVDGTLNQPLEGIASPLISPNGSALTYNYLISAIESDLGMAAPDGSSPRQIGLPGKLLTNFTWSPSSEEVAVVMADVSDYTGRSAGNSHYVINPRSGAVVQFPDTELLNPQLVWSPDGKYLFWLGTLPTENGYKIGADLVDRQTRLATDLSESVDLSGEDFLLVTNAAWLAIP